MKKMILIPLAALAAVLFTFNPALAAGPACESYETDAICLQRMLIVVSGLSQLNAGLEDDIRTLSTAQASAASAGDGAEVARLQRELDSVIAERDALRTQVASLEDDIRTLREENTALSARVDDLDRRLTAFLAEQATSYEDAEPVREPVSDPTPAEEERTATSGDAQPAGYRLDSTVYERIGYRNTRPEIPSPVLYPDYRWADVGNCLTVRNYRTDWVILRVAGKTMILDATGHVVADEVPLGPGDEFNFCSDEQEPRMAITPAMESTASSAERHLSDSRRRWVSLQRFSERTYYPHESFGADREYKIM